MFPLFPLELFSRESLGFARIAAISPASRVADVSFNTASIIEAMREARKQGAAIAVFPELAITSYSCGDLFRQQRLLEAAIAGLDEISMASAMHDIAAVVGLARPGRGARGGGLLVDVLGHLLPVKQRLLPFDSVVYY